MNIYIQIRDYIKAWLLALATDGRSSLAEVLARCPAAREAPP